MVGLEFMGLFGYIRVRENGEKIEYSGNYRNANDLYLEGIDYLGGD